MLHQFNGIPGIILAMTEAAFKLHLGRKVLIDR